MRYSVVMPAYNSAAFITHTIASLLAQTVAPTDIIVVDDGSTDDTAEVALNAGQGRVTVLRQQNAGPGAATTAGISHVSTDLIATIDSDDLWLPAKMERQLTILEDPSVGAVFTRMADFRDDPAAARWEAAYDAWLRTSMVIRTGLARQIGPIIDPPGAGDMVDWVARLRETDAVIRMIPEVLVLRRIHPASMTARGRQSVSSGYLQVARQAILRRRQRDNEES